MHAAGMAVESHTVHHLNLTALGPARLASELVQSRAALARRLGEDPVALAYPTGAYNPSVAAAARAAGYLLAVTTHAGRVLSPALPYAWPRVRVTPGESVAAFARSVGGGEPNSGMHSS